MKLKSLVAMLSLLGAAAAIHAEPRGYLGVYQVELTQPMQIALGVDHGVLLTEIAAASPAEQAGLRPGDVLVRVDSQEILRPTTSANTSGPGPNRPCGSPTAARARTTR